MKYIHTIFLILLLFISASLSNMYALDRVAPKKIDKKKISVRFNRDYLKASFAVIDVRTPDEKKKNKEEAALAGPVIIFLHGHNQQPEDGLQLTSDIAMKSKSGIVVIPVCATPMGKDKKWRGDDAKDVILMDMIRYALIGLEISVDGYKPITEMTTVINDVETGAYLAAYELDKSMTLIRTKLALVGWSHGSILARRMACRYPEAVSSIVQMSPGGFEKWKGGSALFAGFAKECININQNAFKRKELKNSSMAGNAIIKGQNIDTFGSCQSCFLGNFTLAKPFRASRDTDDCAAYLDDANCPVPNVPYIIVLFSEFDSLFKYRNTGLPANGTITKDDEMKFFNKYYPSAVKNGARVMVKIMPGDHIGPYVYSGQYADLALASIGQMRDAWSGSETNVVELGKKGE